MKCRIFVRMLLILVFLFFAAAEAQIQQIPADIARFKAEEDYSYVEVYFSIPRDHLEYRTAGQEIKAEFTVQINVFIGDSLVHRDAWRGSDKIDSFSQIQAGQRINDKAGMYLREGKYDLEIAITDLAGEKQLNQAFPFHVNRFSDDKLDISDIELALEIKRSSEESKFVKNGYFVFPNPYGLYGFQWPLLSYYCEIYNLSPLDPKTDSTYSAGAVILNDAGEIIQELPGQTRIRKAGSLVETGSAVVSSLVSGRYTIRLEITDHGVSDTVFVQKTFYVYRDEDYADRRAGAKDSVPGYLAGFMSMPEDELDEHFDQLRFLSGNEEKRLYKDLDLEGKRRFMIHFWTIRNPDPLSGQNIFMREYQKRIEYVKDNFSLGPLPGWRSDRGRIYLIYGEPDDIFKSYSSRGDRSYEIWYYDHLQTGVEFVFVDRTGFGQLELVHSTHRSEVYDREWRERWLR